MADQIDTSGSSSGGSKGKESLRATVASESDTEKGEIHRPAQSPKGEAGPKKGSASQTEEPKDEPSKGQKGGVNTTDTESQKGEGSGAKGGNSDPNKGVTSQTEEPKDDLPESQKGGVNAIEGKGEKNLTAGKGKETSGDNTAGSSQRTDRDEEFASGASDDEDDSAEYLPNRKSERRKVVKDVLRKPFDDFSGILGVDSKENYPDQDKYYRAVLDSFVYRAQHAHPAFNKGRKANREAKKAIDRLRHAARQCGISERDIKALNNIDGYFDPENTVVDGKWTHPGQAQQLNEGYAAAMEVDDSSEKAQNFTLPGGKSLLAFHQQVYEHATEDLKTFIENAADTKAEERLNTANQLIKQKNKEAGVVFEELGFINVSVIVSQGRLLRQLLEKGKADPSSVEIKKQYESGLDDMKMYNERKGYPTDWYVPADPQLQAAWQSLHAQGGTPGANGASTEVPDGSSPQGQAEKNGEGAQMSFPWNCGRTAFGDRIISHWKLFRGTRCIVESIVNKKTVYTIQSGQECGLLEVQQYLAMPNIHNMNEQRKKEWSFRDRGDFVDLLWAATARYKTHQKDKNFRSPDTACCVLMKTGIELMVNTKMCAIIGETSARARITSYCGKNGTIPPHLVEPEAVIEKKVKVERGGTPGIFGQERNVKVENADTPGTPLNSKETKSGHIDLTARIESLEKRLSNPSSTNRTAPSNMEKMAERMGAIERALKSLVQIIATSAQQDSTTS